MKTRQELQKEVNWLKSELNEAKIAGQSASVWHEYYLNKSKKLQSELEEQKRIIIEKDKEIEGQNLINKNVSGWLSELETDYNALDYKYTASENRLFEIKSKSLFQLIRWWYNAKN